MYQKCFKKSFLIQLNSIKPNSKQIFNCNRKLPTEASVSKPKIAKKDLQNAFKSTNTDQIH